MSKGIPSPSHLPGLPESLIPHLHPGIRLGLGPLSRALQRLGDPQRSLPTILVGGTNGKGSTIAFLESIIASAGARVGTFTSPSLSDFAGHMAINGAPPTQAQLNALSLDLLQASPEALTPFELAYALALLFFKEHQVDLAVIEVGMGGAGDATNLSDPLISLVTQVAMDHQAFLGGTLEAIGREKAGIARAGRPFISAAEGVGWEALSQRAEELGAEVLDLSALVGWRGGWRSCQFQGDALGTLGPLRLGLSGEHQRVNAALALACASKLKRVASQGASLGPWVDSLNTGNIEAGLKKARLPGRLTWVCHRPRVLFDGAHNPHGSQALAQALKGELQGQAYGLVLGIYSDKDAQGIVDALTPGASRVATVSPPGPRGMDAQHLLGYIPEGIPKRAFDGQLGEALAWAREGGGVIVVSGSFSLYGPLLRFFGPSAEPGACLPGLLSRP